MGEEKWKPSNRIKLTNEQILALPPLQRSKYMAYEDPPKHIADDIAETRKRIALTRRLASLRNSVQTEATDDMIKNRNVMGHLKAAEASNRIVVLHLHYNTRFPLALKAMRLEALLPTKALTHVKDQVHIDRDTRYKIEQLMN